MNVMRCNSTYRLRYWNLLLDTYLATVEASKLQQYLPFTVLKQFKRKGANISSFKLQQSLPFTVCAEGCETAEEQSDDEVRTSQVPEWSEGKTKVIR